MKHLAAAILLSALVTSVFAQDSSNDSIKLVKHGDKRYFKFTTDSVEVPFFDKASISPNRKFAAVKATKADSDGYTGVQVYGYEGKLLASFQPPSLENIIINNRGNVVLYGKSTLEPEGASYVVFYDKSGHELPLKGYKFGSDHVARLSPSGRYFVFLAERTYAGEYGIKHIIAPKVEEVLLLVFDENYALLRSRLFEDWAGSPIWKPEIDEVKREIIIKRYARGLEKKEETLHVNIKNGKLRFSKGWE